MGEQMIFNSERNKALEILIEAFDLPIHKDHWFSRYPIRAVEEFYKLNEGSEVSIRWDGGNIICEEMIISNFNNIHEYLIKVSREFPFEMSKVFLIDPKVSYESDPHLYPDDSLCLIHPDDYQSRISLLEIRNMIASWCFCYDAYNLNGGNWVGAEHRH